MSALAKTEQPAFWDLTLDELLPAWDWFDKRGTDLGAIRTLCKFDRYYLLVKVLGRKDMLHPWVYERCREVERAPDDYLDIWGREHFKSSIITIGGGIQAVLNDPDTTIGIFSHTKPIAKGFMAQIKRELENNATLKLAFPDVLYVNPQKDSPSWSLDNGLICKRKTNPKECTFEAHGLVDGQPTSKHFSLRIYDDVVTRESVGTAEQIQKTTECWELSDNLGIVGGRRWHTGTRYSYADTYEAIIKRGSLKLRHHPATHNGQMDGKPVLFTQAEWDRRVKDQGEQTVACQMLGNPLAGHQRMFNVEDLQVYEVRPETLNCYILVDPARSKKKDSANTAMTVIGVDYALNKYLLDGVNHKMDLNERWLNMRKLWEKWNRAPGIQSLRVGYEKFGAQSDLDYFLERKQVERIPINIEELAWPREGDGSKIDRVQRLGPDLRNHRFYLPYPTDMKNLTKNQMEMDKRGYTYRLSRAIKGKDENGNLYDLTEQFKQQIFYFPFGGLVDLVDAASRIYDLDPNAPAVYDHSQLEPEHV